MRFDYSAAPKEEVKACNLCSGTRFDPLLHEDRYGLPVDSVRCQDCGLAFLNPRMTRDAYRDFYAKGHYRELLSEFYGRRIDAETIKKEQRAYAVKVIRLLEPHLKARRVASLLDVGGSTGVVAEAVATSLGLDVRDAVVLEIAGDELDRAKKRGLRILDGLIEDIEPDGERFDLILLCQTMDHLLDIAGSLRTLRMMLEEDGLLFADIVSGDPIKVDHPYYLGEQTTRDFLKRAGFKVLSSAPDADGKHVNFVCGAA